MRTIRLLIGLGVLMSGCAHSSGWRTTDTAIQGVVTATLVADYLQTRQILDQEGRPICTPDGTCGSAEESNPIIRSVGATPYFVAVAGLHALAMRVTPKPYRYIAQSVTIVVQVDAVRWNYQSGFGFRW